MISSRAGRSQFSWGIAHVWDGDDLTGGDVLGGREDLEGETDLAGREGGLATSSGGGTSARGAGSTAFAPACLTIALVCSTRLSRSFFHCIMTPPPEYGLIR